MGENQTLMRKNIDYQSVTNKTREFPWFFCALRGGSEMPLVVHSFMEDTVNPYGTIVVFLVEKDVVSDFMAQKPGFDGIVLYFQEGR